MRTLCKFLAIMSIMFGIYSLALAFISGDAGGQIFELRAFVGSLLFGSGLISLTILVCTEPRWPADDRLRRERYSFTADDEAPHDYS
jgi:hypothetical protein